MNFDLLEIYNSVLGGPAIRHASAHLGESDDATRAAVRCAGPALLAGLMQRAAAPNGPAAMFRCITDSRIDTGAAARLGTVFDNRGSLESLLGTGESLTGMLFGARTGSVTNAVADVSGVRPNSAMMLLSLAAPLLFGILKKYVANNDLDAAALHALLLRQQNSLERNGLDRRVAGALGFGSMPELLSSLHSAASTSAAPKSPAHIRTREGTWMPWATAAAIAVFGAVFFVNRTAEHQETPPGAVQVAEGEGDSRLRIAETDSTRVYFDADDSRVDGEARERIASIAQSARKSDQTLTITGYTDANGREDRDRNLARDRASAVRDALVDEGVSAGRIVMDPPREVPGTEEESRRVDIDVR